VSKRNAAIVVIAAIIVIWLLLAGYIVNSQKAAVFTSRGFAP
jgi:regulator of protease activity HflC (stomatin/prohibitin superfamily)